MKLLEVSLFGEPKIDVREVMPYEPLGDRNKKPFITTQSSAIKVIYQDKQKKVYSKTITAEAGYTYDGASIPFKIGKGNMKLLVPALFHDIMCEDKSKINFHRNLSSLIFRELLRQCGVNKFISQMMYLAVDNYQRFMRGWKD